MKGWADFLTTKETPEGDGNLLGNTQVLLGSNLGNASGHLTTNLPIILAGGVSSMAASDFRQNQTLLAELVRKHASGLGLRSTSLRPARERSPA